jgi:hypothetical protein
MRSLALRELLPLASPVDKIVLGRKYGFDDWLTPAFVAICARAEPLSVAEAKRMDNEDVARIYLAREQARGTSTVVSTEVAQKAVVCAFGNKEEETVTTGSNVMDDSALDTCITINDPNHCPQVSYAREIPSQHVGMNLPVDDVEVDDELMEALSTWSRLCSHFDSHSSFDHSASGPHNQYGCTQQKIYAKYRADYESVLTYVGGPQLQATSLRRFLSVILQSDLHKTPSSFCTELFTDLRNQINEHFPGSAGISAQAPLGKIGLTCMVNELCLELVNYECTLEDPVHPFNCRKKPARLAINLANAGLLTETTWRTCFVCLIPLPANPGFYLLRDMCTFLTKYGKDLDRESSRDLINDVFVKLRKHAIEWGFESVRQDIFVGAPSLLRMTRALT